MYNLILMWHALGFIFILKASSRPLDDSAVEKPSLLQGLPFVCQRLWRVCSHQDASSRAARLAPYIPSQAQDSVHTGSHAHGTCGLKVRLV